MKPLAEAELLIALETLGVVTTLEGKERQLVLELSAGSVRRAINLLNNDGLSSMARLKLCWAIWEIPTGLPFTDLPANWRRERKMKDTGCLWSWSMVSYQIERGRASIKIRHSRSLLTGLQCGKRPPRQRA